MTNPVFLRQNVLAEPLFNRWYSWAGLVNPVTAAMYIANSHLKIMQSFVSAPQVHISALKNPRMSGGPFINYDASRVDDIKEILERTKREQDHMLQLAEAIKVLDEVLANEADGMTLEPLYQKIPVALRGYVELVYDSNNHPSVRFIEGLLYKSPYYSRASQGVSLSLIQKDARSFVFSTPRLSSDDALYLDMSIGDKRLDELFKMKELPQSYDHIKELLDLKDQDDRLFSSLFTQACHQNTAKFNGEGVRIRYFGHACLLIESKGVSILSDPVISYKIDSDIARYTYADLPPIIDYVLITHAHQDHCMIETLLQLRHKIRNIIVPKNNSGALIDTSLKLGLRNISFENVIEIEEMEAIPIERGEIIGLPFLGEHGDLNIRSKTAYSVNLEGKTIVLAADSNNIEPRMYQHIHKVIGDIDVLFLGMECDGAPLSWIYGPLLTKPLTRRLDQSRRLNGSDYEKAISIVNDLRPKRVYVYAMGQEPWLSHVTSIQYAVESRPIIESNRLVESCRNLGIISERLFGQKEILLALT